MENKKAVAFAVVDWLTAEAAAASASGDADRSDAIEMAALSVGMAYDLHAEEANANRHGPLGRYAPLEEVLARGAGPRGATAGGAAPTATPAVDPAVRDKAEKIKNEGNELMGRGDIHAAVQKCVCSSLAVERPNFHQSCTHATSSSRRPHTS